MQTSVNEPFGDTQVAADIPPLEAYGLSPGRAGYSLADLRCAPAAEGRRVKYGVYSEFAVGLVLAGAFSYAGETGAGIAVPGSFVFGNKDEEFSVRDLSGEGNRRLVLFFSARLLRAVADDLSLNAARFPLAVSPPSPLTLGVSTFVLRIARRLDDGGEAAVAVAQAALRSAASPARLENVSVADTHGVIDVVRYINANMAAPCSLDVLASIAGMNRFRFARRFRAVTGETANQYVLNRRLSAAATRLVATRAPIMQIAHEVGFNDLSYFYARFKSAFGSAPGAWRRLQRELR